MDQLLSDLNFTHWMWFVAMVVFLFLEMMAPGIAFLWLAAAAGVMGGIVLTFSDMSWEMQTFLFTILSIASVIMGRKLIKDTGDIPSDNEDLNQRGNALIGRKVAVAVEIKDGRGKVKVGDSIWTALGADTAEGTMVTVTAVNGTELTVE